MLALVLLLLFVVIVVRAMMRPAPTEPIETKRVRTYSRVPWAAKYIDVPVSRKPTGKK